ncbi:hypothetical protein BJ546DRAFT_1057592 [Cryomyces antarcticus]|uniref:Uncharacterized protein n=1 Tax=Cryomyces antarcticus TaxID=329879 RepID=A0ABR0LLG8_9PEZI|nr:hypothetical protein LTR60_007091 [Cryomyces antarcticus]KAK5196762.1 hypothetical protein LTR16_006750 [Cryomyces antarcticus]
MSFFKQVANTAPLDYISPPFPSLYWPFPVQGYQANYLYYARDVWRYTLTWTLIFYGAVHIVASGYAVAFVWALINALVLILSSFAIQGGL